VAMTTQAAPSTIPTHHGPSNPQNTMAAPAAIPKMSEPANPSQDFFGLIDDAMGCEPKRTPAVYPPISEAMAATMNATTRHAPSVSASISNTKQPMSHRYANKNTALALSRTKPWAPSANRHSSVPMTVRASATAATSIPPK